ncbi:MAG: hypothetical protein JWM12_2644, partial [Ilumatobacteraceae bacterium]|nr:hypothetical protein [Ilumatobacteraceae bacterium]
MIKPDLIMLSMPGFGAVGDWRDYAAFAWTTEQMSTICHLTGYPESGPLFTGTTCGDPLAGLMGALAMLAAVNHRRRTGEGQHIDLSQVEASTTFVGEKLIECQLIGADPMRAGNANSWMAPHGIYPCDDDRWVAIACEDDDQWRALWSEMELGGPLPYQSVEDRLSSTKALDELIAAWTAGRDADELMHRLQSVGIAAATVMNGRDMLADAHLREREWFVMLDREEIGVKHHLGEPFRFRDAILPPAQRAAYLGEHNHQILGGELGLTAGELDELERDKVIGTMPIGTVTL